MGDERAELDREKSSIWDCICRSTRPHGCGSDPIQQATAVTISHPCLLVSMWKHFKINPDKDLGSIGSGSRNQICIMFSGFGWNWHLLWIKVWSLDI